MSGETSLSDGWLPTGEPAVGEVLVAALSHGIRTPLHSLLGFLELLVMSEPTYEQQRLLDDAMEGADGLVATSERLLSVARLLSSEPLPGERFSLTDLLAGATALATPSAPVSLHVDPALPAALVGASASLRQVLVELVGNAVAHGAAPVSVTVELEGAATGHPGGVNGCFRVRDAGPGVGSLEDVASTIGKDGRGLGLFLCSSLAARMGGALAASRTPEGFEVVLRVPLGISSPPAPVVADVAVAARPLPAPRAAEEAQRAAEPGSAPQRTLDVLLVEDNPVNRLLTQRQMARLGHRLDTVNGGAPGVEAALDGDYDVVLMDRHLPDLDGLEATRRIRAEERRRGDGRRNVIVALTADALPGNREECLAAGMDAFLTKPLDLHQLRDALDRLTNASDGLPGADKPSAPAMDPGALARLAEQLEGDDGAVSEMLAAYLDELPGRRLRLQLALRRASQQGTIAAAESLRASSTTVGAVGLAALCRTILDAARGGDLATGRSLLPSLLDACEGTAGALAGLPVPALPR